MYNRVRRVIGKDAKLFGVCAGLSRYIDRDADPVIMRLIFVFLGIFSGVIPMVLVYLILALALKPEDKPAEKPTGISIEK
jgi:phage shock protein PspC (stress-responsive transcriptional regulator)